MLQELAEADAPRENIQAVQVREAVRQAVLEC